MPRIDLPDKVTGRPRFLHDLVLPGMLFGRVVRPPAVDATLVEVPDLGHPPGPAAQVRSGDFLAVIAETDRAAVAAAARLARAARWTVRDSLPDERDLKGFLLAAPAQAQPVVQRRNRAAAGRVTRRLAAEFSRPFIAHASVAPSCAVARWDGDAVTVWSHSQGIFALRGALAAGLGLDPARVTVHHVEGAGVYGHNAADDAALSYTPVVHGDPRRVEAEPGGERPAQRENALAARPHGDGVPVPPGDLQVGATEACAMNGGC